MKVIVVQNGVTTLVLTPESEIEKLQLKELLKGTLEIRMADAEQILSKNVADSLIIATTKPVQPPPQL